MVSFNPVLVMSAFLRLPALLVCAATLSRAQTAPTAGPTAPLHSHTPAASSHSGVIVLDQFVTSAAPFARNQVDVAQSTTVLSGRSLLLKQQPTLGETLAGETGIHATSFGPGASRPIIRGLTGDRIRLLENGVGLLDASVTSPDHAVGVEPFLVERIEVVRGPASLLYGSSAVGGVVNVITHRIETDLPTEPVRGGAEVRAGTAAEEIAGGGVVDLAVTPAAGRAVVLHLDGFRRSTENLRIPGFAESARLRAAEIAAAVEHGESAPPFAAGRLPNSALDGGSASAGLSFVTSTFHFGASYSGYDSNYGVPGHDHSSGPTSPGEAEGVRIELRQRRTDLQGEWHGESGWFRGARMKFGHARYRHAEREPDGEIGTVFTNKGHDARFELLHGDAKPWSGALGVQMTRSDFGASGEEAFLPGSTSTGSSLFAFEEIEQGRLTWQFGARLERTKIATATARPRRDDELSGSIGAVWKLSDADSFAVSLAHTGRAPNPQELFARGAHAGTQSYEIGSAGLSAERSLGLEASLRRRTGFVTGAATVFAHRFGDYIFEQPTNLVAVRANDEWTLVASDAAGPAAEGALPVYRYEQRDAQFWGAELETTWHLHESTGAQFDLRLAADLTRAREGARNLPRIPAARTTAGLLWATAVWSAGAECQFIFAQNRVAPNETPSDGYALVNAHVSRVITWGHANLELFARGTNLTNAEARPHTSFVKDLAPLAGRGVVAGVRLAF